MKVDERCQLNLPESRSYFVKGFGQVSKPGTIHQITRNYTNMFSVSECEVVDPLFVAKSNS
jgi:hypothetical protein